MKSEEQVRGNWHTTEKEKSSAKKKEKGSGKPVETAAAVEILKNRISTAGLKPTASQFPQARLLTNAIGDH